MKAISFEEAKAMSREERRSVIDELTEILNKQNCDAEWKEAYSIYQEVQAAEDEAWREENYEDFRAYELRMNEPDFDWGFYSDWHKDMYGYRPHKEVIPANDEERLQICEAWHRERGL